MKDVPEERAVRLANYIVGTGATVRAAAAAFGYSKSLVHKDVTERLAAISPGLWRQVRGGAGEKPGRAAPARRGGHPGQVRIAPGAPRPLSRRLRLPGLWCILGKRIQKGGFPL